jgi:hypothetical protein
MKHKFKLKFIAVWASVAVLAGCASRPSAPPGPPPPLGKLQVTYSTGGLKETPREVTIVRRETTGRQVAAQVGLGILMLAFGGVGFGVQSFSKDDLKGDSIEEAGDRANIQNPVSTTFIETLQAAIDERMTQDQIGQDQGFRRSLAVSGGSARLIYDSLIGSQDPLYQLSLELDVYKPMEEGWGKSNRSVPCSDQSKPPRPLAYWSESSYANVRQELDLMLAACQEKTLAELPRLLQP